MHSDWKARDWKRASCKTTQMKKGSQEIFCTWLNRRDLHQESNPKNEQFFLEKSFNEFFIIPILHKCKIVKTCSNQTDAQGGLCLWLKPCPPKRQILCLLKYFPYQLICLFFQFKYFVAKIFFLAFGSEYQWASLYEPWMTWGLGITQEIHKIWLLKNSQFFQESKTTLS